MAVVYSKVLLFDPPLIYTAPDICVFGAVHVVRRKRNKKKKKKKKNRYLVTHPRIIDV